MLRLKDLWLATTLLIIGFTTKALAQASPLSKSTSSPTRALILEVRPEPRLGATLEHQGWHQERWSHTLSFGTGTLGDIEVRTAALASTLSPAYPWLAWRLRPINLDELPPIEHYLSLGIGFWADSGTPLSWDAGFGIQFQLPPLAPEPADDLNTYLVENVRIVLRFALRFSVF